MDVLGSRSIHLQHDPVRDDKGHEAFELPKHEHEDKDDDKENKPSEYVDINALIELDRMVANRKRRLQEQAQHHVNVIACNGLAPADPGPAVAAGSDDDSDSGGGGSSEK